MGTPLRKTAKGIAEVETRAHRLPPRARSVLIMVDGRRGPPELVALLGAPTEAIVAQLLAEGFVEPLSAAGASVGVTAAPATSAVAAALDPADAARLLPQRQREAARAVNDLIGPLGDSVALRIERSRTPADLRQALTLGTQVIGNSLGASAAAKFSQRFLADWP